MGRKARRLSQLDFCVFVNTRLFWSIQLDFLSSSSAFRILLESDEDRLLVVFNRGLILMTEVNTNCLSL
jgi:hypothetical protein